MDKLIRILNNDYDLSIQWDGLRKFWYVGLTDEGVRKRDERDAENGKLRELVRDLRLRLSYAYDNKELVEYDERLKELGIEAVES